MKNLTYATVSVGDPLPAFTTELITRTTLALYAGASGDHNPIHIDTDFAKAAGMEDVFAQGMLSMAYLARLLTNWAPQNQLRSFHNRFAAITNLGDEITCSGRVADKFERGGEKLVSLEIQATNQRGEVKLVGDALIALP